MSDADARALRDELGEQICGNSYRRISGINLYVVTDRLQKRIHTGELGLRAFFMPAFQCLLFSNTDTRIRIDDVKYTQDIQNMANKNWCKAVVDRLSIAARLYKKDFAKKGINTPIRGCGIFVAMLYVDNLQHGFDTSPFLIPRCAFLDSKTIDAIANKNLRGDVPPGTTEFGHLRLRSIADTCYDVPIGALAILHAPVPAPAPVADHNPTAAPNLGAAASALGAAAPTATGTSADVLGTSHDPGGHASFNIQPPVFYQYPNFISSFGQSIINLVGRSRKSDALNILKAFDESTSEAKSYAQKAVKYSIISRDLMAKAHDECYIGIQKLIADAIAEKRAAKERRRKVNNDTRAGAGSGTTSIAPEDQSGGGSGTTSNVPEDRSGGGDSEEIQLDRSGGDLDDSRDFMRTPSCGHDIDITF